MNKRDPLTSADVDRVAGRVGAPHVMAEPGPRGVPNPDHTIDVVAVSALNGNEDHWVYSSAERAGIVRSLFLADGAPWLGRFGFLLAMSVIVATLGLANDQPAAVIAAMVMAPLMTPVLGIATSFTLGMTRQTLRLLLIVTVASVLAVVLAWVISASLVVHELTAEELSRTIPRLRDLVIALAAGGAGMYSVVRKDLSGVIPGVAIAVALVPPLATIGIVAELGEWSLAGGAALLYGINVLAIILAAVVVLLITDFIESPPLRDPRVFALGALLLIVAVAVVVPVRSNSLRIDREVTFESHVEETVATWDDDHPDHRVVDIWIEPGAARLVVAGAALPDDLGTLRSDLATDAFPQASLEVDWVESAIIEVEPGS